MTVTVSTRGQIVIPADIRKRYHITPASRLEFIDTGKEIVVVPIPKDSFARSRGVLKGVSTKDLQKSRRATRRLEHAKG